MRLGGRRPDAKKNSAAFWIGYASAVGIVAFLSLCHLSGSPRISILSSHQRPLVKVAAAVILNEPLSVR